MQSDFTYTCVGSLEGGTLENFPITELDFQSDAYEVCIMDMLFMPGAWNNVREGANIITWSLFENGWKYEADIPPGNYATRDELVAILNSALKFLGRFQEDGLLEYIWIANKP